MTKFNNALLLALFLVSSMVVATAESNNATTTTTNDDGIPFYLKRSDSNPNQVIAVVYYGELGDTSKEIDVPCTMMMKDGSNSNPTNEYYGPESIMCTCQPIGRTCNNGNDHYDTSKVIDNSKCQLKVPFQFDYDVNGTIVSVTFNNSTGRNDDDIMIVPFYPQKDKDGNIIAVSVSSYEQTNNSSAGATFITLLIMFLIVATGIFIIVAIVRYIQRYQKNKNRNSSTTTTTTVHPMNVKNISDLEDPVPVVVSQQPGRSYRHNNNHTTSAVADDQTTTDSDDSHSDN